MDASRAHKLIPRISAPFAPILLLALHINVANHLIRLTLSELSEEAKPSASSIIVCQAFLKYSGREFLHFFAGIVLPYCSLHNQGRLIDAQSSDSNIRGQGVGDLEGEGKCLGELCVCDVQGIPALKTRGRRGMQHEGEFCSIVIE